MQANGIFCGTTARALKEKEEMAAELERLRQERELQSAGIHHCAFYLISLLISL